MCRLLAFASSAALHPAPVVESFARACRESPEYQGHGWGIAWLNDAGGWCRYRSVTPIWDDDPPGVPETRMCVIHARSAFRNEGIEVGNNMPFLDDGLAFAFNGELRGVRLTAPGSTGAARLLHLLGRFRAAAGGDVGTALRRLDEVVTARTEYVRALNVVVAGADSIHVLNRFSEDPGYFTLWQTRVPVDGDGRAEVICSEPITLPGDPVWRGLGDGCLTRIDSSEHART